MGDGHSHRRTKLTYTGPISDWWDQRFAEICLLNPDKIITYEDRAGNTLRDKIHQSDFLHMVIYDKGKHKVYLSKMIGNICIQNTVTNNDRLSAFNSAIFFIDWISSPEGIKEYMDLFSRDH